MSALDFQAMMRQARAEAAAAKSAPVAIASPGASSSKEPSSPVFSVGVTAPTSATKQETTKKTKRLDVPLRFETVFQQLIGLGFCSPALPLTPFRIGSIPTAFYVPEYVSPPQEAELLDKVRFVVMAVQSLCSSDQLSRCSLDAAEGTTTAAMGSVLSACNVRSQLLKEASLCHLA